jgi:hypothetical protein
VLDDVVDLGEKRECADCGVRFVIDRNEASWFAARDMPVPKRCRDCRRARREAKQQRGGDWRRYR